jgi:serine/threonine-protein kinase
MARALREAHALGVVHRDMKPGNVYLVKRDDDDDVVKVLDFGLVKDNAASEGQEHTQFGQIMGSPRYMAPEQVQGKNVDARTDVYSVGAMLYAMLAGKPPFDRASDLAILMAQVSEKPPPIASVAPDVSLPQGLEALVMKCLAKNPADRFASMEELINGLKLRPDAFATASDSGALASPQLMPPILSVQPQPARRGAVPWLLAGVAAVALVTGVALMSRRSDSAAATATPPVVVPTAAALPVAPPPPTPAPAPVATASLHVDTDPPGAKVKEEGEVMCEATPCDILYTGAQADPTFEHLLTFLKADYKLERKIVKLSASPYSVKMTRAR